MKSGYSIIELMLVCALVLIVCTISMPTFFNKASYDLTNELNTLETICIYLQQRACATHQTQTAHIDTTNNIISWQRNNKKASHTLGTTLKFGFMPGSYGPPADPIAPITQAVTFTSASNSPSIEFFSNGKISSGSIYITGKKQQIMGALTLGVSQVSYIRRYIYQTSGWIII